MSHESNAADEVRHDKTVMKTAEERFEEWDPELLMEMYGTTDVEEYKAGLREKKAEKVAKNKERIEAESREAEIQASEARTEVNTAVVPETAEEVAERKRDYAGVFPIPPEIVKLNEERAAAQAEEARKDVPTNTTKRFSWKGLFGKK
ncbi:hypothetical protein HQ571_02820 [Candidatus Kuenenbacteria bacterium]|nr:hypothetical protein [Candidatus Kuenenbacteria bacterium]